MSISTDKPVPPRHRIRWSLRTLFIALTLIAALVALVAFMVRPELTLFTDPWVLNAMANPDRVEIYAVTSFVDVANGVTSTNGKYPVLSPPKSLNGDEWAPLRTALASRDTYLVLPEDVTLSYVAEFEYRVRLYNQSSILDFEIALSHVEVLRDGERIHFAFWADDKDKLIFGLCEAALID